MSFSLAGAPQVIRHAGGREVVVARGQDALLRLVVCADPRPRRALWEWGSQKLEAGDDLGRYKAEELAQASGDTCSFLVQASPQDWSVCQCNNLPVHTCLIRQVTLPDDICFYRMCEKTATRRDSTYGKSILRTPETTTWQWRMSEGLTVMRYTSPSRVSRQNRYLLIPTGPRTS